MLEDKLTHDERLRLECIAQANMAAAGRPTSAEVLIAKAKEFEEYVKGDSNA